MTRALALLALLVAIVHPAVLAAGLGAVLAVLEAAAAVITHPVLLLVPEVAFIAVMAVAIGRSAGVPIPWRTT